MTEFFQKTGPMAIATRMRLLSERMTKESEKIFDLYNVDIKPKWYPVVYTLMQDCEPKTVTKIACEIKQSHVSVIKIVKEMSKAGLIIETKDENDARKTNIILSQKGQKIAKGLTVQHRDTTIAMEKMLEGTTHNLWLALNEFETLLDDKSTYPRVLQEKKARESKSIVIVNFESKYAKDFELLNKEWINRCFEIEEKDKITLENPQEEIINKGGEILVALHENRAVGVCALLKMNDGTYDYELSKMAILDEFRGIGIGFILGEAIIKEVQKLGGKNIFLETNTVLTSAIALYEKLGFKKISQYSSFYERSNYQMEYIF